MQNYKIKYFLFFLPILIGLFFIELFPARANNDFGKELKNCLKLSKTEQEKCISDFLSKTNNTINSLKKREKSLQETSSKIKQDVQNLKNQITYLNAEQEKTGLQVNLAEQEIALSRFNISKTEADTKETEITIAKIKQKLGENIIDLYEYDKKNIFTLAFAGADVSKIFNEFVYIEKLNQEINNYIGELRAKEEIFGKNKTALSENIKSLELQIESYNRQIAEMDELREQKSNLLEITKGDDEIYKEILENIKSEKKQIALLTNNAIVKTIDTSSSWWYYSQRNYSDVIPNCYYCTKQSNGNCVSIKKCTIASHGCAITSISMLYTRYGKRKTPPIILGESSFDGNGNIYWPSVLYNSGHGKSWSAVRDAIEKKIKTGDPAIIFIRVSGNAGHYIVVYGKIGDKYLVNDPYFGQGIYLEDSLKKLGSSKNNIDQILYLK